MHHWTDEALILSVAKFGDTDALVQLFTPQHGVCRGVVKRGFSGKTRADLQPATLVEATWKARLSEHMGSITLEAKHSFAARVMQNPLRLAAVASAMGLLAAGQIEHDPHPPLYAASVDFLKHVAAGVPLLVWLTEYVRLELFMLEQAGFGLDLTTCAATGNTHDLIYVSPKSGRAVCRDAGLAYHDRLFALPLFLTDTEHLPDNQEELQQGLALTGHFIENRMLPALHRHIPPLRTHFLALLGRLQG